MSIEVFSFILVVVFVFVVASPPPPELSDTNNHKDIKLFLLRLFAIDYNVSAAYYIFLFLSSHVILYIIRLHFYFDFLKKILNKYKL